MGIRAPQRTFIPAKDVTLFILSFIRFKWYNLSKLFNNSTYRRR